MSRNSRRHEEQPGLGALALAVVVAHPRQSLSVVMGFAAVCAIMSNALFLQSGQHPAPLFAGKTKAVTITQDPVALPRPRIVEIAPAPQQQVVQPPAAPVVTQVVPAPVAPAPVAAPRNRADIITDLQRGLSRKGFYDGPVDGIWGSRTDASLRDFFQAAGLRAAPEASEDVLRLVLQTNVSKTSSGSKVDQIADMLSAPRDAHPPVVQPALQQAVASSGSRRLLAVQRALAEFGYGQVKLTGTMGPETQAAIERFERDRRLPVTGQLSERLLRELSAVTGRAID